MISDTRTTPRACTRRNVRPPSSEPACARPSGTAGRTDGRRGVELLVVVQTKAAGDGVGTLLPGGAAIGGAIHATRGEHSITAYSLRRAAGTRRTICSCSTSFRPTAGSSNGNRKPSTLRCGPSLIIRQFIPSASIERITTSSAYDAVSGSRGPGPAHPPPCEHTGAENAARDRPRRWTAYTLRSPPRLERIPGPTILHANSSVILYQVDQEIDPVLGVS